MSRLRTFDQWITGVWWWRRQRRRAEQQMDDNRIDDAAARSIHQAEWVPMAFAEKYGRPAPPSVRAAVEHAEAAGADPPALAVVVANRDIMESEAGVVLRKERFLRAITIATRTISFLALAYWMTLVLLAPIPLGVKSLLAVVGALLIACCAAIWEFYGGKSLRAMRAVRAHLEQSIQERLKDDHASAQVIDIATRLNR